MQKRILSFVLALAMVVCMVPSVGITAFASEDVKNDVVVDDNKTDDLQNNNAENDANLENDKKPDGEVNTDGDKKPDGEVNTDGDKKPEGETKPEGMPTEPEAPKAPEAAAPVVPQVVPFTALVPAATEAVAEIVRDGKAVSFETFDKAFSDAKDGETIVILKDCTTEAGINLSKNINVVAKEGLTEKPTLTFTKYGMAIWAKKIVFENVNIVMNKVGSTPYTGEWHWMTICGQAGSEIDLINVDMLMDAQGLNKHAIYADNGLKLYMEKSNLVIKNYVQDALEWNGGSYDYNVEMVDSTYISDHNRSGFTGTFNVKATKSKIDVINSRGNGSNGSNFYFTDSVVNFNDNGSHGLSATVLESTRTPIQGNRNGMYGIVARYTKFTDCKGDKKIQANNNGYNGVRIGLSSTADHKFKVVNSDFEILDNGFYKSTDTWSGLVLRHVIGGSMDKNSTLTVRGSANNGIRMYAGSDFTIEEGAKVDITENLSDLKGGNGQGGGIRIVENSKLVLPSDAKLYNNHAEKSGDDIYMGDAGSEITFGTVGNEWYLDGIRELDKPGCEDKIDGWYIDGENDRWDAHSNPTNIKLFDDHYDQNDNIVNKTVTIAGPIALKAAHGINTENPPVDPENPPVKPEKPEWKHSKSKVATNLDKNFESEVTLGLPSAEEELVSDIVFVLDKSTSTTLEDQALAMLTNLKDRIAETGAKVKVGVVVFNNAPHQFGFFDLETSYGKIEEAIKFSVSSGTNTHGGMLVGKRMLDEDTSVPAERKHLVFVSDGITYMFNEKPTVIAWNGIVDNAHEGDDAIWANWSSPDAWKLMYGDQKYIPEDWAKWLGTVKAKLDAQGTEYEYPYKGEIVKETPKKAAEYKKYAMSVDKALYNTYVTYQECMKAGYNCYSMVAEGGAGETNPWGPSFMKYLAGISCGEDVTFDDIEKEIVYFLDAGSKVKDVIGYGKDNKGNDYNFDFVKDVNKLTLKVGNEVLKVKEIEALDGETKCYGFFREVQVMDGYFEYPFVLHYYANGVDGKSDECFIWDINEAIENFRPVQLTYTVKLTNPQTKSGKYGEFDADGSEKLDSLLTNVEAVLLPVDSNGVAGNPEEFPRPTVDYEVKSHRPRPTPEDDDDDEEEKKPRPYPIIKPEQIPSTGVEL